MGQKDKFYADIMAMHSEVTGSCHLVVVKLPNRETRKFIVDCGLFQEKEYEDNNDKLYFGPENIDFCLVTHNHVDHVGRLPFIVKNGFDKLIHATAVTCKLLPLALIDSYKVLKDVSKHNRKPILYEETDVEKTLKLTNPIKYNETIEVMEGIKATFFKNGHLVGSALILVQISYPDYEDINILFTGDYNGKNVFFDVPDIPEWVRNLPLTIVQESTYGYMDSTEVQPCFKTNLLECISKGGTAVVPVFSLGRSQEMLYTIKCMQDEGILDSEIPIYFDGNLAFRYTEKYLREDLQLNEDMKEFLPNNLIYADSDNRKAIMSNESSKIILTTSGMGSHGPAQMYIPAYITRPNALIHFTGYCAEGTMGYRLKNTEENEIVEVSGMILKKRARVEYTTEYSSHAKADEMIEFLKQFNNLKLVLVNHGEEDSKKIFAGRILDEVETKYVGVLGKEYYFRINPYGLVKTLSTKFE